MGALSLSLTSIRIVELTLDVGVVSECRRAGPACLLGSGTDGGGGVSSFVSAICARGESWPQDQDSGGTGYILH